MNLLHLSSTRAIYSHTFRHTTRHAIGRTCSALVLNAGEVVSKWPLVFINMKNKYCISGYEPCYEIVRYIDFSCGVYTMAQAKRVQRFETEFNDVPMLMLSDVTSSHQYDGIMI